MKTRNLIPRSVPIIFVILLIEVVALRAQSSPGDTARKLTLSEFIQKKHGFDNDLINGIQYHYPYPQTRSHPFYGGETSFPGCLVLSGSRFEDIRLQYDLFAQHLVLEYDRKALGFRKIYISPAHTDAFEMGGNRFIKITLDDKGDLFYQVIQAGGLTCYIHWKKNRGKTGYDTSNLYYFTNPGRTYYLDMGGCIIPFSGRRELASLFSESERKCILRYMRQHKVKIQSVSMIELSRLFDFISMETEEAK